MIDVSASNFYTGDCRELLCELPDGCVQTCITSPPYWGLRDYGVDGQIGIEETPAKFIDEMVGVFESVRRVLAFDGTLWLNLGDCYAGGGRGGYVGGKSTLEGSTKSQNQSRLAARAQNIKNNAGYHEYAIREGATTRTWHKPPAGWKSKDLIGMPWRVAFALHAAGWYLRSDIIWSKPNPMPEPVDDRPTKSHEYIFLLSKSENYFYDADAIREPLGPKTLTTFNSERRSKGTDPLWNVKSDRWANDVPIRRAKVDENGEPIGANKRTVWTVSTQPYDGAHFATFPPKLIEPCVLAGSRPGDLVLDLFFGSGTVGEVAEKHGRRWIGFDLNPAYAKLQAERTAQRSLILRGEQ